jgi:tetratricopeptide (TPR) repeat protein
MPSNRKKRRSAVPRTAEAQKKAEQPSNRRTARRENPLLDKRRQRLVLGGVLLVTAVAFLNSLDGQFVYDDRLQVLKNPAITRIENIPKMFTQSVWQFLNEADKESTGPYYRPLFNIALTINYGLFGLEVAGWHLFSLLVHLVVTLLVYALAREWGLSRELAAAAALLFGLHPVHSESVAWVAALPDPLAAVFILSSLLLYERRRRPGGRGGRYGLAFGILFALMAMLTKEVAIVFPVFLICRELLDRTPGESMGAMASRAITRSGPFLAIIPIYLALRYYVLGFIAQAEATAVGIPTMHVIATLPSILLSYARMLFLPFPLAVMYDNTYVTSPGDSRFWAPALAVGALLVGALWLTRNSTAARSSLLLLALFLVPVLNLKAFRADESLLHDRYLYLPSIGFCLLVAMALGGLAARFEGENRRLLPGATAALALVLFVLTVSQNSHWQSEEAMTSHALEVAPEWPFLHNYIGAQYSLGNRMTEAERAYQKALSINPRYYDSLSNLGDIYRQQGRFDEAVRSYTQAIESGAPYADTYYNLGVTYTSQGKLAQAEEPLRRAIELRPSHRSALYNLGWVYDNQDKRRQAEEAYVNTLRRDPAYVEPRINLGVLLTKQGRYNEALEQLQSAQRLAPDNIVMMYALGDLYMRTTRYREAVDILSRLATREPSHRLVHTALGLCYENLGDKEQAKASFQRAIEVAPQDPYTNVAREHLAKL